MISENINRRKKYDPESTPLNFKTNNKIDQEGGGITNDKILENNQTKKEEEFQINDNKDKKDKKIANNDPDCFIVAKIETIYGSIKETEPYFLNFPFISRFLVIFNTIIICTLTITLKKSSNNLYCWDYFHMNFIVCNQDYNCDKGKKGQHKVMFLDSSSQLTNKTAFEEFKAINNKYSSYFIIEQMLFSKNNFNEAETGQTIIEFFNAKIYIDENEKWNTINLFRDYCKIEHTSFIYFAFLFVSAFVSPVFIGLMADIYGRKRVVLISLLIQSIFLFFVFMYIHIVTGLEKEYYDDNKQKYIDFVGKEGGLFQNYANDVGSRIFSDDVYGDNFAEINLIIDSQERVRRVHSKYKFWYFFSLFMVVGCMPNFIVMLSLTMEKALHDYQCHDHYYKYMIGIPFGFFIFTFLYIVTSIKWIYLALSSCSIIYSLVLIFLIQESPRYLFEYRDYKSMTEVFEKTVTKHSYLKETITVDKDTKKEVMWNPLEKFYTKTHQKKKIFKSEILSYKEMLKDSLYENVIKKAACCQSLRKMMDSNNLQIKNKGYVIFKKSELITHTFLLFSVIFNSKNLKSNYKIIFAVKMIISFVYYLSFFNIFSPEFFSRTDLYSNIQINFTFIVLFLIMFISFTIFSFIMKFFDHSIVLLINFLGILLFSLILGSNTLKIPTYDDINEEYFGYPNVEVRNQGNFNDTMKVFMFFFASGLYYALYFIILKYSKTLYRCTLLGISYLMVSLIMFFTFGILQYFVRNILYISVVSILGLVNLYFLIDPNEMNIILEFTKLEISD